MKTETLESFLYDTTNLNHVERESCKNTIISLVDKIEDKEKVIDILVGSLHLTKEKTLRLIPILFGNVKNKPRPKKFRHYIK